MSITRKIMRLKLKDYKKSKNLKVPFKTLWKWQQESRREKLGIQREGYGKLKSEPTVKPKRTISEMIRNFWKR